jgi:lysophospholipase L1-like esterase
MASRSQFSQALVSLSLIVSLFIAVYSQAPAQAQTAAAPNVIAIGDSVTEDFGNGGWRGPLKTKLAAVGQAINYVGSRSDGAGSHEAYGGATSCDFSTDRGSFMADTYGKSATWDIRTALAAAAPNIAIIDIGTNNYIEDYYLAQGLATTVFCGLNPGSLHWLWDAVVYYPGITGVVITTIEDAMIPEGTENVNVLVRQYVADRQAQGLNVCLGELPSSFAGLTTDRYHLNAAGKDAVATALLTPTLTAIAGTCAAAVTGTLPVVSIAATANAAEPSTNGQFTVSRTGSTASSLTVNFTVSGSATAGSDYANIGTSVVIPAGSATAAIAMNVIDDTIYEGNETVVVTLSPNASYAVGSANSATVTIADNESAPAAAALSVSPNGASQGDLLTVTL